MDSREIKKYTTTFIFLVVFAYLIFFAKLLPVSAATLTVCFSGCNYTEIQYAVDASVYEDTILVKNGIYRGFTVSKKVTILGENIDANDPRNNGATINGQVVATGSYVYDQGPLIRGFRIIGGVDPVVINDSTMTVKDNYITGNGDGISINKGAGVFQGNYIDNLGDDGIDVDSQKSHVIIEGNYIFSSGQDGIEIRQQPVTLVSRVSMWIRNNKILGSGEDGLQIMDYANFSNRHYVVERNLFLNNAKAAIGLNLGQDTNQTYTAAPMPEPLYAINNSFIGNDAGISGGANLVAINNIFSMQNSFDLKNVTGRSIVKNSLFAVTPHFVGSNNIDNATIFQGNPMLDSNYLLSPGSPAIDKGTASYQHTYNYDGSGGGSAQTYMENVINLNGSQYNGNAPDLGWKESGQTGTTPTPTRTPTPGATSTPTPTGNPTPTPTSGANAARLKFKIRLPDIFSTTTNISSSNFQVELRDGGQSVGVSNVSLTRSGNYFQTAADASFNISQNKAYTVVVKVKTSLGRIFNGITLTKSQTLDCTVASNASCGELITQRDNKPLNAGDSDGFTISSGSYNKVDSADLQTLASQFNTQAPTTGPSADFNLDGQVNISDLEILGKNYGQQGG